MPYLTAIIMNTVRNKRGGKMVSGQVSRIIPNYDTETLRIYVIDIKNGNEVEVHPESIFREMERDAISAPDNPKMFEF